VKRRALTDDAFYPHVPAQQFGKLAADGQSEPRPAVTPRRGTLRLAEGAEQPPDAVGGDADPRVFDREV
jgi:hypothetical protein